MEREFRMLGIVAAVVTYKFEDGLKCFTLFLAGGGRNNLTEPRGGRSLRNTGLNHQTYNLK